MARAKSPDMCGDSRSFIPFFPSLLRFVSGIPRANGSPLRCVGNTKSGSRAAVQQDEANKTLLKFGKGKCHIPGQGGHLQSRTWDNCRTASGDHVPFWAPQSKRDLGVLGPAQQIHQAGWDMFSIAGSVFLVGGKGEDTADLHLGEEVISTANIHSKADMRKFCLFAY